MKNNTVKDIKSPADFNREYLKSGNVSMCKTLETYPVSENNFCIVGTLEEIKGAQKRIQFEVARKKFFTIVLVTAGLIKEKIGFNGYEFGQNTLYFVPENQLHTIEHWSRDVKGFHCIFDVDYFLLCLKNQVKVNDFAFFQPDGNISLTLSEAEVVIFTALFRKIKYEYCSRRNKSDDLMVRLYLNIFLLEAERLHVKHSEIARSDVPRRELLVANFRKLVSKSYKEKRQVSDYAALLYVSPHYLNDTVKEFTGSAASDFIHDSLISEAKSLLVQTELSVAQVARELNYSDQSYFCRFFKSKVGISAKKYREQHSTMR